MINILIIDDDFPCSEMIKEHFDSMGCKTFLERSGEEGLEHIKRNKPDILILDNRMIGLRGIDVLKQIREMKENIFVIMVTVDSAEKTKQEAEAHGVDGFLKKPLNVSELSDLVVTLIARLRRMKKGDSK
jgi:DNA-binding response OmpR family regulator